MQGASKLEGIPEIIHVRQPLESQLFARRAARFRSLALSNPLDDYLTAMARLADAQHAASVELHLSSKDKGLPGDFPLNATEWRRDESWRFVLEKILAKMGAAPLPATARAALRQLSAKSAAELETDADALLAGNYAGLELSSAPFLGAALQVYWTALARDVEVSGGTRSGKHCPVCASPAVAGFVQGDSKLRYLVCGLCSTEWRLPRLTCSNCGSTEGVSYLSVENDSSGARAECCAQCRTYLKLFYRETTPAAEPFADDVATLVLDTLVSDEGFSRTGPNFYLLPGA